MPRTAIVVGAGIVGLAAARALATRNYKVQVLDRSPKAVGASVRNFGMIWPIGQPDGKLYERAMRSASIWKEVCAEAGIWHEEAGSLHLAHHPNEWEVLQELEQLYAHRGYQLLSPEKIRSLSPLAEEEGLLGGLYSPQEIIVDPRQAIGSIPGYLQEKFDVEFSWGRAVTEIDYPFVVAGDQEFSADEIYVCSGADFETLFPAFFASLPVTKCKLQMMRLAAQPGIDRMGPAVCGGLSLVHYKSFAAAGSLRQLRKYFEEEMPDYLEWGIHVMACQNQAGELTVGDSHEYGLIQDPFDRHFINQMILAYLKRFLRLAETMITETWNGTYPKLTNGETELVFEPTPGVTIINCLSGAGMTLSFGLCDEIIGRRSNMTSATQPSFS